LEALVRISLPGIITPVLVIVYFQTPSHALMEGQGLSLYAAFTPWQM